VAGRAVWNSLPAAVCDNSLSLNSFKSLLKTQGNDDALVNIILLRCDDSVILVPLNTCCVLLTYRLPADMLKSFVCQTITSKVGRNIAFLPLQRLKFYPRMVKQIQIFQSKFCRTAHHDPAFHCKQTRTQPSAVVLTTSSQLLLKPRLHDTTCCQTGCQSGLTTG